MPDHRAIFQSRITKSQPRQSFQHARDRDLRFHASQRRADTKVSAMSERDVLRRVARHIEPIWVSEFRRITIRRPYHQ